MTTPDHGTDAVAEARYALVEEANISEGLSLSTLEIDLFEQAVRRAVLAECVHCGEREGAHADAYVCIPGAPDVAPPGTVFESRAAALARLLQHDVD